MGRGINKIKTKSQKTYAEKFYLRNRSKWLYFSIKSPWFW